VVVTAGGTREPLDPVRFLGNRSSGKQGVAIAEAARARGAEVTLIAANLEIAEPAGCDIRRVSTALELQQAVTDAARGADVVVMAAAVADYRPADISESKLKKDASDAGMTLELVRNPDILAGLGHAPHDGTLLVGFAARPNPTTTTCSSWAAPSARPRAPTCSWSTGWAGTRASRAMRTRS
jgi:phosphopantothenoylcysteine decarboxylase/phosphopantothenate--cysteine ligase